MLRKRLLATTAVLMALASPAHAENDWSTAEGFLKAYATAPSVAGLYIHGVYDGLVAYNAYELAESRPLIFCPPAQVAIVNDQLVDILRRFIVKFPEGKSTPVQIVLLYALRDTFPCK